MVTLPRVDLGATPVALVPGDGLLLVIAALAAGGVVVIGILAFMARRRTTPGEVATRRPPSPSSVGLADDPIVAALGVAAEQTERGREP